MDILDGIQQFFIWFFTLTQGQQFWMIAIIGGFLMAIIVRLALHSQLQRMLQRGESQAGAAEYRAAQTDLMFQMVEMLKRTNAMLHEQIQEQKASHKAAMEAHKQSFQTIQTSLQQTIAEQGERLKALEEHKVRATERADDAEVRARENRRAHDRTSKLLEEALGQLTHYEADRVEFEKQMKLYADEMAELKDRRAAIIKERDKLQKQVEALEANNQDLRAQTEGQAEQIKKLQKRVEELSNGREKVIEELTRQVEALRARLAKVENGEAADAPLQAIKPRSKKETKDKTPDPPGNDEPPDLAA